MRRFSWPARHPLLVVGLGLALFAACTDKPGAPPRSPPEADNAVGGVSVPLGAASSTPFAISDVMRKVGHAFRAEDGRFRNVQRTFEAVVDDRGVELAPVQPANVPGPDGTLPGGVVRARPARFETIAMGRGAPAEMVRGSPVAGPDGDVEIRLAHGKERLKASESGVEQRWEFEGEPDGHGDLVVRVGVSGQSFVGVSEHGLHFRDESSGLGLRYGVATWVDGDGRRTTVAPSFADGEIRLRVAESLLEASSYPAVLDPEIGGEFSIDNAIPVDVVNTQDAVTVAYGGGVWLYAWHDYRSGTSYDIYGARVTTAGELLDPNGLLISREADAAPANNQIYPDVAFDATTDQFGVFWQDFRDGVAWDIRGALVPTSGTALAATSLVVHDSAPGTAALRPAAAFGDGRFVVLWDSAVDVFASTVFSSGAAGQDGIVISNATGKQLDADLAYLGTQFLAAWRDERTSTDGDIYATRLDVDTGDNLYRVDAAGIGINTVSDIQAEPAVTGGGSNFYVAWRHGTSGDVYGTRVSAAGAVLDGTSGTAISAGTASETKPSVAFDGTSYVAAWTDTRSIAGQSSPHVFAARVQTDGSLLDASGILLAQGKESTPALAATTGQARIGWTKSESGLAVYAANLVSGAVSGTQLISRHNGLQINPSIAFDPTNERYMIVWVDGRNQATNYDIYGALVSKGGQLQTSQGIPVATSSGVESYPRVVYDGTKFIVVYRESAPPNDYIRAKTISLAGVVGPTTTTIAGEIEFESQPDLAWDDVHDVLLVIWKRSVGVRARRLYADLTPVDVDPIEVCCDVPLAEASHPRLAWGGENEFVAVWEQTQSPTSDPDIYRARIAVSGGATPLGPALRVAGTPGPELLPVIASAGGGYLVAWQTENSYTLTNVTGRFLDAVGGLREPVEIAQSLHWESTPAVAAAPAASARSYFVAWSRTPIFPGSADIYGTLVRDGTVVTEDGFLLVGGGEDETGAAVAFGDERNLLLAYHHRTTSSGTERLFGKTLIWEPQGQDCETDTACVTGFCTDGYCCDTACGGGPSDCQACDVSAHLGACTPIPADPAFECRGSAGDCDLPETCNGVDATCPADRFAPATVQCREASTVEGDDCDLPDFCTGSAADCPDVVKPDGVVCREHVVGTCDAPDKCDGSAKSCVDLPNVLPDHEICRPAVGACDVAEHCESGICPATDTYLGSGVLCRRPAGECDEAEVCTGGSPACPSDLFRATGNCDSGLGDDCPGESVLCSGTAAACPVTVGAGCVSADATTLRSDTAFTVAAPFAERVGFLYDCGSDCIQKGASLADLFAAKSDRLAVVRGLVTDTSGIPLPGVRVAVLRHDQNDPEDYGYTYTRVGGSVPSEAGWFDLAVLGGERLTLEYRRPGYLPVQRTVYVPAGDYTVVDDVAMTFEDPAGTQVTFPTTGFAVAQGARVGDADGERRLTVIFPPGTHAFVVPAGGGQPIEIGDAQNPVQATVRLTEYTVGNLGPAAMPGELPGASAYTYAAELSINGADSVIFKNGNDDPLPVSVYHEDFLGLGGLAPGGADNFSLVPLGTYDSDRAAWVAENDGAFVRLLAGDVDGPYIDFTGDGVHDHTAMGIATWERNALASLGYPVGQELVRLQLTHFTPIDPNFRLSVPGVGNDGPKVRPPKPDPNDPKPCEDCGSVIEVQNRTLREHVAIPGTPISLVYSSSRVPGRASARQLVIPVSGSAAELGNATKIHLEVQVAGRLFSYELEAYPNQTFTFDDWDGLDAYGREVQGETLATVRLGYEYPARYEWVQWPVTSAGNTPSGFGKINWGRGTATVVGDPTTFSRTRQATAWIVWRTTTHELGRWNAAGEPLPGFTVDLHHRLDVERGTLHFGDGRTRSLDRIGWVMDTILGAPTSGNPLPIPAPAATLPHTDVSAGDPLAYELVDPIGIEPGPDGSFFLIEQDHIRKVDLGPSLTVTTLLRPGSYPENVRDFWGMSLMPDGGLLVSDAQRHVIRRISTGTYGVQVVAGNELEQDDLDTQDSGHLYVWQTEGGEGQGALPIPATCDRLNFENPGRCGLRMPVDVQAMPGGSFCFSTRAQTQSELIHNTTPWNFTQGDAGRSSRIRCVGPDGFLYTVVGGEYEWVNDIAYTAPMLVDAAPVNFVELSPPEVVAAEIERLTPDPRGGFYFTERDRVFRLGDDGNLDLVAGAPFISSSRPGWGEGIPATETAGHFTALAAAPSGDLYLGGGTRELANDVYCFDALLRGCTPGDVTYPDPNGVGTGVVRVVTADGRIRTIAGTPNGGGLTGVDAHVPGLPALSVQLGEVKDLALLPDGSLLLLEGSWVRRLRRAVVPGPDDKYRVPSEDGTEVYVFDLRGQHEKTIDARTGAIKVEFVHGECGSAPEDGTGCLTEVKVPALKDGQGVITYDTTVLDYTVSPATITPPHGGINAATTVTLGLDGYVETIDLPGPQQEGGAALVFTYADDGLLQSFHDARGEQHAFFYEEGTGKLDVDVFASGYAKALDPADEQPEYGASVEVVTPLGRVRRESSEQRDDGTLAWKREEQVAPDEFLTTVWTSRPDGTALMTSPTGFGLASLTPSPQWGAAASYPSDEVTAEGGVVRRLERTQAVTATGSVETFRIGGSGPPEDCSLSGDEDADGRADCADPDCAGNSACAAEACAGGVDDDGDGLVDCADPDCAATSACPPGAEACAGQIDEDGDGLVDCADPDCARTSVCVPDKEACAGALDEDGDGLVDCADPDCAFTSDCAVDCNAGSNRELPICAGETWCDTVACEFTTEYEVGPPATITATSPLDRVTVVTLDALGREVQRRVGDLEPVFLNRSEVPGPAQGQVTSVVTGARTYTLEYYASGDHEGRLWRITDPENRQHELSYRADGKVSSVVRKDAQQAPVAAYFFEYDGAGALVKVRRPCVPVGGVCAEEIDHNFDLTPDGKLASYRPPLLADLDLDSDAEAQTTYAYDADLALVGVVLPGGRELERVYDPVSGRLTAINGPTWPVDDGTTAYDYDEKGRVSSIVGPQDVDLTLGYTGSLPKSTTWSGAVTGTVSRTYDSAFRVHTLTVGGVSTRFRYDADGSLSELEPTGGKAMTIVRDSAAGKGAGLATSTTVGTVGTDAVVTTSMTYNQYGEVRSIEVNVLAGQAPGQKFLEELEAEEGAPDYETRRRDGLGRIRVKRENLEGAGSVDTSYGYSALDFLTSAGGTSWTYDVNGNRTPYGVTTEYDDQDRLLTHGTISFTYGPNGEVTSRFDSAGPDLLLSYDAAGNLRRAEKWEDGALLKVLEYEHDGLGRRVAKYEVTVVGGVEQRVPVQGFLYDGQLRVVAELDGSGAVAKRFVYGTRENVPDLILADGTTYRIVADHLGSPRMVIDAVTGDVTDRMNFDAWGKVTSAPVATPLHPFGFAGGLYDSDLELVRFGARDYDPVVGRWMAKDPIRFAGGDTNIYAYVGNDPVNRIDPSGKLDSGAAVTITIIVVVVAPAPVPAKISFAAAAAAVAASAAVGVGIGVGIDYVAGDAIQDGMDAIFGDPYACEEDDEEEEDECDANFMRCMTETNGPSIHPDRGGNLCQRCKDQCIADGGWPTTLRSVLKPGGYRCP